MFFIVIFGRISLEKNVIVLQDDEKKYIYDPANLNDEELKKIDFSRPCLFYGV